MTWPATLYWVNAPSVGRLAVAARPRSAGTFRELKAAGVDVLVSMLEPDEAADVGLADEARYCAQAGITFIHVAVTDFGTPASFEEIEAVTDVLTGRLVSGHGVAAHCYAGLGRSPVMVASVLIHQGLTSDVAIERVSAARGVAVPEMDRQHVWLHAFAKWRAR